MKNHKHRHAREGGHASSHVDTCRKAGRWAPAFAGVTLIMAMLFTFQPALAEKEVTGSFNGKTMCQNGLKKAGFKMPGSETVTFYSYNEISHEIQALSWPQPDNPMSFDARETEKTQLKHVLKLLRALSCDTQDNPAQSGNGLNAGTQNGTTANSQTPIVVPGAH